jgi:hypothetical protein
VQKYLEGKFGDALEDVSNAMVELAKSFPPSQLAEKAYTLYERFRPEIPPGKKEWGPPASWTGTSSVRWLRPESEERLLGHLDPLMSFQLRGDGQDVFREETEIPLSQRGRIRPGVGNSNRLIREFG